MRSLLSRLFAGLVVAGAAAATAGGSAWQSSDSTWRVGDVFVGIQNGTYLVRRPAQQNGVPAVEELPSVAIPNTSGWTAGCAVDWVTGRLYTTDFESVVTEVDPSGTVRRQLFTPRLPRRGDPRMTPENWISWAPESIAFSGDLATRRFYVGHVEGLFESSPYIRDVRGSYEFVPVARDGLSRNRLWPFALPNPSMPAFGDGTLRTSLVTRTPTAAPVPGESEWYFVLDYSGGAAEPRFLSTEVTEPGANYAPVRADAGGFLEARRGAEYVSVLDANGNPVPARFVWGKNLHAYDAASADWAATAAFFDTTYGVQGTDWIDLASDQRTIFYTSESNVIFRYDVGGPGQPPRQLPPFAVVSDPDPNIKVGKLFALRLLPPGDGSGGLLVAGGNTVYRLDGAGRVVRKYSAPDGVFALSLSPDAKTVWVASQGGSGASVVRQIDLRTGGKLREFEANGLVGGLCVMLEYTAPREPCNGLDDDGDGVVDNNCPPAAAEDVYTLRLSEGTSLSVSAPGVLANDRDPDGDPLTAVLADGPGHGSLTLNFDGSFTYTPAAGFVGTDSFTYRANEGVVESAAATVRLQVIDSANQPPVCTAASAVPATLWPPDHRLVRIRIDGVTDADGDPVTLAVTSIRQDEPVDTEGDGRHAPDGRIVADPDGGSHAEVRAERVGTPKRPGDGRVYHTSFTADDGRGGACSGVVRVCVPHDRGRRGTCVDGGPLYDSTEPGARGRGAGAARSNAKRTP